MLYFGIRARLFKNARFQDPAMKRMLSKLQNIEKAALPEDELREVMDGTEPPGLQAHAPRPRGGWEERLGGEPECLGQEEGWRGRARASSWGGGEQELVGRCLSQPHLSQLVG